MRSGVLGGELADSKDGPGPSLERAVAVRATASTAVAFFGVRGFVRRGAVADNRK